MKSLLLLTLLTLIAASKYAACSTPAHIAGSDAELTSFAPCKTELWARTYGPMKRFGVPPTDDAIARGANPYVRSKLWHRCVQDVKGTVRDFGEDDDGDYKVRLELDNSQPSGAYSPMLPLDRSEIYQKTKDNPNGDPRKWLTVEIVCAAEPRWRPEGFDTDRVTGERRYYVYPNMWSPVKNHFCTECVEACRDYKNTIYKPKKEGEVIYVTGELIRDRGAGENRAWCSDQKLPCSKLPRYIVTHDHMEIHPVTSISK